MGWERFDLERDDAFESIRDYGVGVVGVNFVRDINKGMRGGADEDSEIGWHDQGSVTWEIRRKDGAKNLLGLSLGRWETSSQTDTRGLTGKKMGGEGMDIQSSIRDWRVRRIAPWFRGRREPGRAAGFSARLRRPGTGKLDASQRESLPSS